MNRLLKFSFLLFIFFIYFFSVNVSYAATYCVRADGNATKVNAIGPDTDPANCMSMATHNASTFSAGDIIQLSDKGGNYSTALTVPSSGISGSVITYDAVSGEYPIIAGATNPINTNGKSYLSINHISITSATNGIKIAGASSDISIASTSIAMTTGYGILSDGNVSNITIDGATISGNSNYEIYFYGLSNSNLVIKNVTISNGKSIRLNNINGLTIQNINQTNTIVGYPSLMILTSSGVLNVDNYSSYNSQNYGVQISDSSFSSGSIFKNSNISSSTLASYYVNNSSGFTLQSNTSINPRNSGFYIIGSHDINLISNTVTNTLNYSFYVNNSYNINFSSNYSTSANYGGFMFTSGSHDITSTSDTADGTLSTGFWADGTVYNLTYTSSIAKNGHSDGFGVIDNVHDVTYNKCLAFNNGNKSSTSDGDGFTSHITNYNIYVNNSIAYNNTASGYAMVGNSSGHIYNSIAYNNSGDWSSTGGVNQVRGNFYFSLLGLNPTTNTGWDLKNSIGYNGYQAEIWKTSDNYTTQDYNLYKPISDSLFATLDGGNLISWNTYSSREPNSNKSDPLFINAPTNFALQETSPVIDSGTDVGLTTDYSGNPIYGTPDIGPYEYQPPYTIGTDKIDIGGGARIYEDGKFRTLHTANTILADLAITPSLGFQTFSGTTTRPSLLDVSAISWTNSGDHYKSWTESSASSTLTNTIHTVGDLKPNTQYSVSVDDILGLNINGASCISGVCLSNSSGEITFTYTGTYSTHKFDVVEKSETQTTSSNSGSNGPIVGSFGHITTVSGGMSTYIHPVTIATTTATTTSISLIDLQNRISQLTAQLNVLLLQQRSLFTPNITLSQYTFSRNLSLYDVGVDVVNLQKFLNAHGFFVADSGDGSLGQETTLFGIRTYKALKAYQLSVGLPDTGFFGPMTRESFSKNSR